jgi:O-antigen/teichoic acid export membrane protein
LMPYVVLLLAVPLINLSLPALAVLERRLDYRSVAGIDILGQVVFGAVAVPLGISGAGVWAPVAGFVGWHLARTLAAWIASGLRPQLHWSANLARDLIHYGIGYSSSMWIWQLRNLVNPLIIGGILGVDAVALIGLANTIIQTLSFARRAAWRLALVGLAKVQDSQVRSTRMLNEAMFLQVLALGPLLAGFAVIGPLVFPLFYRAEWSGMFVVYPFMAFGALVNAVFNMHSSHLYVHGRNLRVAVFHVVHVVIFAGTAWFAAMQFGMIGFGYAEGAAVLGYVMIHRSVLALGLVYPSYSEVVLWLGAYTVLLFAPTIPLAFVPLLGLPLLVVALLPRSRRRLRSYTGQLFQRSAVLRGTYTNSTN